MDNATRKILEAVITALDLPHPATVGDAAEQRHVLAARAMHTTITLRAILDGRPENLDAYLEHLHAQLAQHPANYTTWGQR